MPDASFQKTKTIAIIGGGPAASATALALKKSLSQSQETSSTHFDIEIFYDDAGTKTRIGESIPPAATPVLHRLGLGHLVEQTNDHLTCPGSISLWNSDKPGHNDFMFDVVGEGYHLNRQKFDDQLLAEAIKSGVHVHNGYRLMAVRQLSASVELDFSAPEAVTTTVVADFIVDATGKPAAAARRFGVARNTFDEVIFLCSLFELPESAAMLPHTLVEAVEHGWWYVARLPDNKMIVTFCTDVDTMKAYEYDKADRWRQLFVQTSWLHKQVPDCVAQTSATTLEIITKAAPSSILSVVQGKNWLAVGDAASCYDPITSAGITKALMHAELAGPAITAALTTDSIDALEAYQRQVFHDFSSYVGLRSMLYGSETRFSSAPFWQNRLGETGTISAAQ